jgi:hypothetical protein
MRVRWLVCIDDTDNLESVGTGKLARWLGATLLERGLVEGEVSVTRHQLLVHPDIPYTTHNSSACLEAWGGESAEALLDAAREYLKQNWHEGANPGLCVIRADSVPQRLVEIARSAQREVLELAAFDAWIRSLDLALWSSGETGQGRIGACAGAALRSTGEDGRFIGLRGIRELEGRLSAREICARSGVEAVRLEAGASIDPEALIDTGDWVRPSLIGGRAVLVVREELGRLVPAERRSKDD